jgi:hypothetical protein
LKHASAKHPLLQLQIAVQLLTPEFFEALAATTTLTYLIFTSKLPLAIAPSTALKLTALPTLRAANFTQFPIDSAVTLLQSRSNWSQIRLPSDAKSMLKFAAFAPRNQSDFKLLLSEPNAAGLNPWLCNPHLTALNTKRALPIDCSEALQRCKNLTDLVCALHAISASGLRKCASFAVV